MKLLLWFMLAQAADIGTTAAALHRGCTEKFLMPGHPRAGLAIKGGAAATVTLTLGSKKRDRASTILLGVGASSGTIGAVLNSRALPHCTR